MYKKFISSTISLILILSLSLTALTPTANADLLKVCKLEDLEKYMKGEFDKKGKETLEAIAKTEFKNTISESDGDSSSLLVRVAFEKARTRYHDTIKCIFDASTVSILASAAGEGSNLKKDDLPTLSKKVLGELNEPDKACLDDEKRNEAINTSDPTKLLPDLLAAYNDYSAFVEYLIDYMDEYPDFSSSEDNILARATERSGQLSLIMRNDVQDAIVALDGAFIALKEMRRNFIMHVHFQCMMKNLEAFRKLLANLRKVVITLPSVIHDASMHK